MKKNAFRFELIGAALIMVALALILWFLLRGRTRVIGEYPEPDASSSLTCSRDNSEYFVFSATGATEISTSVVVVFVDNKASNISLTQKYFYNTNSEAMADKGRFQISVEKSFSNSSLEYRALGANYAVVDNMLRMSLSVKSDEIDVNSKKYFLIEGSPTTISGYKENYERQNFVCKENV